MKYYSKNSKFELVNPNFDTKIEMVDIDSLTLAWIFDKPCILNFASHKRPGGGYESVRNLKMILKTQEEDLFRRSNLPELMDNKEVRTHYPLRGLDAIYCVATANKDKLLNPITPFDFGLVTLPAVVNPELNEYDGIIKDKIEMIFNIAIENKHKDLILGAWGCGVFNNDPQKIATLFLNEAKRKQGFFDKIVFAIPGATSYNYQAFNKVISNDNN